MEHHLHTDQPCADLSQLLVKDMQSLASLCNYVIFVKNLKSIFTFFVPAQHLKEHIRGKCPRMPL